MSGSAEAVAATYGRCAWNYDRQVPFFAVAGQRLVDLLGLVPGEQVLDVACGRGACLFPAADRVGPTGHVHGVDLSQGMVEHLHADIEGRALAHASVERMDAQELSVAPGSRDALTCAHALFLMGAPERAAAGFMRVLRPGGRIAVSVPASRLLPGDTEAVGTLFTSYAKRAGLRPRTPAPFGMGVGALLTAAGARHVRVFEEERTFVFPDVQAWWEWTWTVSTRALYEALPPSLLEGLRHDLFQVLEPALTPRGLPATARLRFATATRP